MGLKGKVAAVTGGSEGIGRATVERLADVSVSVLAPTAPDALAAAGGSFPLDRWL